LRFWSTGYHGYDPSPRRLARHPQDDGWTWGAAPWCCLPWVGPARTSRQPPSEPVQERLVSEGTWVTDNMEPIMVGGGWDTRTVEYQLHTAKSQYWLHKDIVYWIFKWEHRGPWLDGIDHGRRSNFVFVLEIGDTMTMEYCLRVETDCLYHVVKSKYARSYFTLSLFLLHPHRPTLILKYWIMQYSLRWL